MSTKHIFASSDGLVLKALRGTVALNPTLSLHAPSKSIYVTHPSSSARVALVAGGGAGHEPAHASYTGDGMLASSVSGDIFASPSASQILTAIELALLAPGMSDSAPMPISADWTPPREVLLVINNYTGDRLNFGLALTRARAKFPRLAIDAIVVADDVSLLRSLTPSLVGARGLAGNILVCKIVGAYAATGAGLGDVKALGEAVVGALASVGVGLAHCHVPGRKVENTEKGPSEDEDEGKQRCEVGMGLHNEPGVRKGTFGHAQELIGEMLEMILSSRGEGGFLRMGKVPEETDEVVLFVNNLGGISQLEMGAVLDEVMTQLQAINVHPSRVYASSYMTSLNAPGFSISVLNVSQVRRMLADTQPGVDIRALLDAPTDAYAWAGVTKSWPVSSRERANEGAAAAQLLRSVATDNDDDGKSKDGASYWSEADIDVARVEAGIRAACASVLEVENDMTTFDTVVGDGDCGETFAAGAKAVLNALDSGELDIRRSSPAALVGQLGDICEKSMGGTIGALLAIFFTSLSTEVPARATDEWHPAPQRALNALSAHTPARPGDRTIVDALHPFCEALASPTDNAAGRADNAVKEARKGAESTRGMNARLGRAVYVGSGPKDGDMPPDPGAWGVAAVLEGFWKGVQGA